MRFTKNEEELLDRIIHEAYVHDSIVTVFEYDRFNEIIFICLENEYFNSKIEITFYHVISYFTFKGNWGGNKDEIVGFTVNHNKRKSLNLNELKIDISRIIHDDDFINSSFQMFSGDEVHILSKEIELKLKQIH